MTEAAFEKKCIAQLRNLQRSWWPDKSDAGAVRGLPDRIGCVNSNMVALEFKKSSAEAAKKTGRVILQKYILDSIRHAGGFATVVHPDNWAIVFEQIKLYCKVKEK